MNSLKTVFIVAVLGAVAYGVYVSINRNPDTPEERETAPVWPEAPQVQIPAPGADMAPPFSSSPTASAGTGSAGAQPSIAPTTATPYAPLATSPPPVGNPMGGPSSPYAANGSAGPSGGGPPAGNPAAAGSPQIPSGRADGPGLASNPVRGIPNPPSSPLPGGTPQTGVSDKFEAFLRAVQTQLDEGHLPEAHLTLSSMYDNPNVPPEQAQKVTDLLDRLAGTVIYSRQHLLTQPYRVRPGDTLERIAEAYKVPPQLLARINGIRDPQHLEPGRELKVVPGPFSALIDLSRYEMTLMVGGRYAGRFPIGVGRDHARLEGSYTVLGKIPNPPYYSPDVNFSADDPNNPLGELWIDLGNQIGIHGTNDPQNLHRTGGRGSVCLGDQDIQDIYGILSVGSRVIIRR
ncbi:MAG: L,D-transpeptidase family protein [Planctomycetota bacterium]|jgi:LysM repeat protein